MSEESLKKNQTPKPVKPTKPQNLLDNGRCSSSAWVCSSGQWLTAFRSPWLTGGLPETFIPLGAPGLREWCRVWGWQQPSSKHAAFILQVIFQDLLSALQLNLLRVRKGLVPPLLSCCLCSILPSFGVFLWGGRGRGGGKYQRSWTDYFFFSLPCVFCFRKVIFFLIFFELKYNVFKQVLKQVFALNLFKSGKWAIFLVLFYAVIMRLWSINSVLWKVQLTLGVSLTELSAMKN